MNAYELTKAVQAWKVERVGVALTTEECKMKFPDLNAEELKKFYDELAWRHPQKGWINSRMKWA